MYNTKIKNLSVFDKLQIIEKIVSDDSFETIISSETEIVKFTLNGVWIETDLNTYFMVIDDCHKVEINDSYGIFHYTLTKTLEVKGLFKYPEYEISIDELDHGLTHLLNKMVNLSRADSPEYLLKQIQWIIDKPENIAGSLFISKNFIKNIRSLLKKKILNILISEKTNNCADNC